MTDTRSLKNDHAPIGTMIKGNDNPASAISALATRGFECFQIMYWETIGNLDLEKEAASIQKAIAASPFPVFISSVAIYGNPLRGDETGNTCLKDLASLMEVTSSFGCNVLGCFAGRVPGRSVPDSLSVWKAVFSPLVERAESLGIGIAFENCRMGDTWKTGKWNIAINPDAWSMMFDALPSKKIGLEWEPCHQIEAFADPIVQAMEWSGRFLHLHGKDARINRSMVASHGIYGADRWNDSCFPGNGETDWKALFKILRNSSYAGTIDIEGWNDAEWSGERELDGQARALEYLKSCRKEHE